MLDPTVSHPAAEREPDHITPDDLRPLKPCAFHEPDCGNVTLGWTPDPPLGSSYSGAVLDAIAETLADEPEPAPQLPAYAAEGKCPCGGAPGYACRDAEGVDLVEPHAERMAVPERRTVSLEVLTPELRAHLRGVSPGDERVGLVLRADGDVVAVAETDRTWVGPRRTPVDILAVMLRSARGHADDAEPRAELLMPTPDVLAALAGTPDATFWTAPVPVMHRDMQRGWLLISYADEGDSVPAGTERQELIEAVADCDPDVPTEAHTADQSRDCRVLTVGGQRCHFDNWLTNLVRIPAAVTL